MRRKVVFFSIISFVTFLYGGQINAKWYTIKGKKKEFHHTDSAFKDKSERSIKTTNSKSVEKRLKKKNVVIINFIEDSLITRETHYILTRRTKTFVISGKNKKEISRLEFLELLNKHRFPVIADVKYHVSSKNTEVNTYSIGSNLLDSITIIMKSYNKRTPK